MISRWVEFCLARTEHEEGEGEAKRIDGIDEAISLHNLSFSPVDSFHYLVGWAKLYFSPFGYSNCINRT